MQDYLATAKEVPGPPPAAPVDQRPPAEGNVRRKKVPQRKPQRPVRAESTPSTPRAMIRYTVMGAWAEEVLDPNARP
jgi:hypothetical protein